MSSALVFLVVTGYLIVRGILAEREMLPALALGTALAWALMIAIQNLWLRLTVPFDVARFLTAGILLLLACLAVHVLWRRCDGRAGLDRTDLAVLLFGLAPASLVTLTIQLLGAEDGDNFIHYPLIALFQKGYFPHLNPYFPDVRLYGHYGRDLGLATLLSFGQLGVGNAIAVEAWLLNAATLGNIYYLGKRFGAGRISGALGAYLAFFAVNAGFPDWLVRSGLAEVMGNNNPVVHAFLFAILTLVGLVLRGGPPITLVFAGFLLGAFDIVYETHFAIVTAALAAFAVASFVVNLRRSQDRATARRLTIVVSVALVTMIASGGFTSHLIGARLHLDRSAPAPGSYGWAEAGIEQRVTVSFPKRPFLTLTHAIDGRPVSLLNGEFLLAQGPGFCLLPVALLVLAYRRKRMGSLCAVVALLAILVPSCIDFGRFNADTFRLIFFSGLMSAVALGFALGELHLVLAQRISRSCWRRVLVALPLLLLVASATAFGRKYVSAQSAILSRPFALRLTERERLSHYSPAYDDDDETALTYLKTHGGRGERLASNYVSADQHNLVNDAMVLIARSALPMTTFDVRLLREEAGMKTSVQGWSGRARAYWATGDCDILRDLGADWLYIVPRSLSDDARRRMAQCPALTEAFRTGDPPARLVYHVDASRLPERPRPTRAELERVEVVSAPGIENGGLERFATLPLRVRNRRDGPVSVSAFVYYRIYDRIARAGYDDRDAVGTVQRLHLPAGGETTIRVPFVFPYNPGDYEAVFFASTTDGDLKLGSLAFTLLAPGRAG